MRKTLYPDSAGKIDYQGRGTWALVESYQPFATFATWAFDDKPADTISAHHLHYGEFKRLQVTGPTDATAAPQYRTRIVIGDEHSRPPLPPTHAQNFGDGSGRIIVAGDPGNIDSVGRLPGVGLVMVGGIDPSGNVTALGIDNAGDLRIAGTNSVPYYGGATEPIAVDGMGRLSSSAAPIRRTFTMVAGTATPAAAGILLTLFAAASQGLWLTKLALLNPGAQTTAAMRLLQLWRMSADATGGAVAPFKRGGNAAGLFVPTATSRLVPTGGTFIPGDPTETLPLWVPAAVGDYPTPRYFVGGPGADSGLAGAIRIPAASGIGLKDNTGGAGGSGNQFWMVEWVEDDAVNMVQSQS